MPTERGVSPTEPGTIWLVRDFPPLFLFAQPDSWMAANWGRGSLAAAAESNALMPLTLFHFSLSRCLPPPLSHTHTHTEKTLTYQAALTHANFSTGWTRGAERVAKSHGRTTRRLSVTTAEKEQASALLRCEGWSAGGGGAARWQERRGVRGGR